MAVNGVTSSVSAYDYQKYATTAEKKTEKKADSKSEVKAEEAVKGATNAIDSEQAAVYESSNSEKNVNAEDKIVKKPNTELINKLKTENEARVQQLQDIVNKLLTKQGQTYDAAQGLKSMYESLEVDEATRAQAEKDIAEDGYWGVEQTSSRIFDFAMALSGGDETQMEKMKDAFLKGFDQATKTWGDELPEISQKTKDAVLQKFEDYKNSLNAEA